MDVLNLIAYFEDIANKHININSFLTGDSWEIAVTGKDDYPQLYLLQNFEVSGSDRLETWAVKFRIHDIQLRDESDENEKLDTTFTIAQQVLEYIRQNQPDYFLGANYDCFSFTESSDDYLAGWAFTIQISFPNSIDRCSLDDVFPPFCDYTTSAAVNPATLGRLNGVFINGVSVPFGAPYDITSGTIGKSELERFFNDLIAAGYSIDTNIVALGQIVANFSLDILSTQDVFTALDGKAGDVLMAQTNCG